MADNPATVVAAAGETVTSVSPSKKAKSVLSPPKAQAKPTHPAYAEMVNAAIEELKERGGSSLQAIKKYITETYKVDTEKQALFIKKYIKAAVASGILIQTKGKGAAGSFKLPTTTKAPSKRKASTAKPKRTVKKVPASKKSAAVEKSTSPKKAAAKKPSKAVAEKKKVPKGPAAKPPKPKTTKAKSTPKSTPKSPVKKAKPTSSPKKTKPTAAQQKKAAPKKTAAQAK